MLVELIDTKGIGVAQLICTVTEILVMLGVW